MYDNNRPAKRQKMMNNNDNGNNLNTDSHFQSNVYFNMDIKCTEETINNFLEIYSELSQDNNLDECTKKVMFKNLIKKIVFEKSFGFCIDPAIPYDIKKLLGTRILFQEYHKGMCDPSHKTSGVVFYIDREYLFLYDIHITPSFDNILNIVYDVFSYKY